MEALAWTRDLCEKDRTVVDLINNRLQKEGKSIKCQRLAGDVYVARFVRARKHVLEDCLELLLANLKWREENNVDDILETFPKTDVGKKLLSFWPNQQAGHHENGRLIVHEHMCLLDPVELLENFTLDDLVRLHIYFVERDLQALFDHSCKVGKPCTEVIVLENMRGLGFRHLGSSVIDMMKAVLAVDAVNYPELLGGMLVVNAPSIVSLGWRLLKPFVDADTQGKIQIHGNNWNSAEQLISVLPMSFVCKEWGGSSTSFQWTMAGTLREEDASAPQIEDASAPQIEIAIAAGNVVEHELQVETDGSNLFFDFSLTAHDIGFSVELRCGKKKPKILVAPSRVSEPQTQSINNLLKGTVVLIFDNSYSYMTKKEVLLMATVRPPLSRAEKRKQKNKNKKKK